MAKTDRMPRYKKHLECCGNCTYFAWSTNEQEGLRRVHVKCEKGQLAYPNRWCEKWHWDWNTKKDRTIL